MGEIVLGLLWQLPFLPSTDWIYWRRARNAANAPARSRLGCCSCC